MVTSQNGINLIKQFEGCRLTSYKDAVGVWTIGYGHTLRVCGGMTITQAQAEYYLKEDLVRFESAVMKYDSKYHWNQNQFDALVSFALNIGSIDQLTANGTRSISEISSKILLYDKAGGKKLSGLTRRRKAEKELFDRGNTSSKTTISTAISKVLYSQKQFVKDVQSCIGAKVDGIAGKETLSKTVTVSQFKNNSHKVVKPLQKYLNYLGYDCGTVDGIAGRKFTQAVKEFQRKNGCVVDGEITTHGNTWKKLLGVK